MARRHVPAPPLRQVAGPDYTIGMAVIGVGLVHLVLLVLYILIARPWEDIAGGGPEMVGFLAYQTVMVVGMAMVWLVAGFVTLWYARLRRTRVQSRLDAY